MFKKLIRWSGRVVVLLATILVTIIVISAFDSRSLPDLEAWHRPVIGTELSAADSDEITTLNDYLALEDRVFRELDAKINTPPDADVPFTFSRYRTGNPVDPERFERNWNRTHELTGDNYRGAVLMVHGLTDSPYSMRHLAELFQRQGFYVLNMRMPAHGTIPGALINVTWEDWMAAVRIGAHHVRATVAADRPFYFVGYSNGGALAVKYMLDAIENDALPMPDRAYLLSPMLGVSFYARFSDMHKLLSWMPYFEKSRWIDVLPEYDPFKYNSFPMAGGEQTFRLTQAIEKQIVRLHRDGRTDRLPPLLAFQSLVDATVSTEAIVERLCRRLPDNGSKLVLFDVNRLSDVQEFFVDKHTKMVNQLIDSDDLPFAVTLVTNQGGDSAEVVAKSKIPHVVGVSVDNSLALAWPKAVYSLSHVAIPFPPNDALYGPRSPTAPAEQVNVGSFAPRGEKKLLSVPIDVLLRLRYNPFFAYIEREIIATLKP